MNKETILEIIKDELMPRIGDELYSQLRDVRIETERLADRIAILSDRIDEWARGECEEEDLSDISLA